MSKAFSRSNIVILAGSGRSGTSWLGSILNSYEKSEYFYELSRFPELDLEQEELLGIKYPLTHGWQSRPNWVSQWERRLLVLRKRWGPNREDAARSLRVFANHDFEKQHPDILLYKIVTLFSFIQRRKELAASYQERLKVVHIIRNPYAQIASELRIDARNPERSRQHFDRRIQQILEDPELACYQDAARKVQGEGWIAHMALVWRVSNEILAEDQLLNKKLVVYEDLCRSPQAIVKDIFDFLGWDMSGQTIDYLKRTSGISKDAEESGNFSLRKNAEVSTSRWRKELDTETYRIVTSVIQESKLLDLWSKNELKLSVNKSADSIE